MSGSDSSSSRRGTVGGTRASVWESHVEKEVASLKAGARVKVQDNIARSWARNREKIRRSKQDQPLLQGPLAPIPKVALSSDVSSDDERRKKRVFARVRSSVKTNPIQVTEVMMVEEVTPCPKMNTWAPIQRNILTEDDNHINIPYFGDEVIDRDSHFIQSFETGVSSKMYLFDDDEDSLYLKLVCNLSNTTRPGDPGHPLSSPSSQLQKLWHNQTLEDRTLPGLVVFQAIATKYPDYGTVEELIKRYRKIKDEKTGRNLIQNIDLPEAPAVSAERSLHSYKSLLCRRCFVYDCPLHNDERELEESIPQQSQESLPSGPCGPECYLTSVRPVDPPTREDPLYRPQLAKAACKKLLGPRYVSATRVWVDSEKTLFRMLVKSFPNNWCAIAKVLMTKNCRQVYEFSKQELGSSGGLKKTAIQEDRIQPKPNKKKNTKTRQRALYKGHSQDGERENRKPYSPCHHPGLPCDQQSCSCRQSANFCEKFCLCPLDCHHRFPGCKCKSKCTTKSCACFLAHRECDPDLCSSCLDGSIHWNPERSSCRNVMIQNNLGKKLLVAPSDIAGWGCFLGEQTAKNEFIAEYVGELISQEESERRGKIYDKAKCSYMFNLNDDFCVDAARIGGKIRFANHSSKPNCDVKILMVNGDHRIGIYANKNIEEGEELFFDYGPDHRELCPDLVEPSSDEEDTRQKMIEIREEARRRRRRANCVYNLRQFNSKSEVKIKPCNVKIARLPPELVDCQDLPDPVRPLAGEKGSSVSWISPGSLDIPSDDSIDELIRSSSDSDDCSKSVEILSSDTDCPPPTRIWRIKKEVLEEPEEDTGISLITEEIIRGKLSDVTVAEAEKKTDPDAEDSEAATEGVNDIGAETESEGTEPDAIAMKDTDTAVDNPETETKTVEDTENDDTAVDNPETETKTVEDTENDDRAVDNPETETKTIEVTEADDTAIDNPETETKVVEELEAEAESVEDIIILSSDEENLANPEELPIIKLYPVHTNDQGPSSQPEHQYSQEGQAERQEAPPGSPRVNVTIDLAESDSGEEESRPRPPPPPSDAAMKRERDRVRDELGVSVPLFVIGGPRTPVSRRRSESDDDVRILPSSSRECQDSGDDVVEID